MTLIDWARFGKELRIHFNEPEPIVTPSHVVCALTMWRVMNANPRRWCTLEATHDEAIIDWGVKHLTGENERSCETIRYTYDTDGKVVTTRYAHV